MMSNLEENKNWEAALVLTLAIAVKSYVGVLELLLPPSLLPFPPVPALVASKRNAHTPVSFLQNAASA